MNMARLEAKEDWKALSRLSVLSDFKPVRKYMELCLKNLREDSDICTDMDDIKRSQGARTVLKTLLLMTDEKNVKSVLERINNA